MPPPPPPFRSRPSVWPAVAFLLGFGVLLVVVSRLYLLPAFEAVKQQAPTDPKSRDLWLFMVRTMRAWWALSLAILLVLLVSGLMLTFRIGRFFFPRPTSPRVRTKHVDAWAESAKRLQVSPRDDEG